MLQVSYKVSVPSFKITPDFLTKEKFRWTLGKERAVRTKVVLVIIGRVISNIDL